jgi:hypothetical protein
MPEDTAEWPSEPVEGYERGWWGLFCFNALSAAQQERLVVHGNLPFGYRPEGRCPRGAEVEVTTVDDATPGPRFYCRLCAILYLTEGLVAPPECTCGRIKVGSEVTEHRNWNPDCPTHGVQSDWYRSPEQQAKRHAQDTRLRDLQWRAREARERARDAR